MLLAKAGAKVTVHERLNRLGGRSGTFAADTRDGRFRFDIGPTFFLYPRVLADIFAACGESWRTVELIRLDPQYRLVFEGGGDIQATPIWRELAAKSRASRRGCRALPRFMADNRAKLAAFRPVLEAAFNSVRHYARRSMLRSLPMLRPHRSVDSRPGQLLQRPAGSAGFRSRANIWACRRSAVPACSRSCRSWNTNSAFSIRAAAAAR